ncbi:hypothetical protein BDN67DRAFT_985700 [Paxillus ammoniavirescens]|nr:hypothetical protein BDN67DRAFT_985700 [Paxillus ammoniavirescens]
MTESSPNKSTNNKVNDDVDALVAQISTIKISLENVALLTAAIIARANQDENTTLSYALLNPTPPAQSPAIAQPLLVDASPTLPAVQLRQTTPIIPATPTLRVHSSAPAGSTPNPTLAAPPDTVTAMGVAPPHPAGPGLHQVGGVAIPSRHYTITYNGVVFILPYQGEVGPYYLITWGRLMGVVAQWQKASPLVIGVSGASFRNVTSVQRGWQLVEDAIDDGQANYL